MPVRVNRPEFLQILNRVTPGLAPKKGSVEQGTSFVFGQGWLQTFNDEIACRTKTGLPDEFAGAVPAAPLLGALDSLPADDVRLDLSDGVFTVRWSDRKKDVIAVRAESDITLPIDAVDSPAKEDWVDLHPDFARGVEQVAEVAGINEEEFITVCVHVHPDFLEATDRVQCTRYAVPTGATRPFLVRQSSLKHVVGLGLTRMGETDTWVHFRNKHLWFSCRRHLEDFPDLSGLYEFRGDRATLPRGAATAADVTAQFVNDADKDNNKVTVSLAADRMVVRGDGPHGYASLELDMVYAGEPLAFRLKPAMLSQLIRKHEHCEIGRPDGKNKLRITGENWVYVAGLGRAEGDDTRQQEFARARREQPADDQQSDDADVGDDRYAETRG